MKKLIIPLFGTLLLVGCGGGGSGSSAPTVSNCNFDKKTVVMLINQARAKPGSCGSVPYPAAGKVTWNNHLRDAAQKHSNDMASGNFLKHKGSDKSLAQQTRNSNKKVLDQGRVIKAGYDYATVAENIAGGYTAQTAINGWVYKSPEHCVNMREQSYTEVGLACSYNPNSTYKTYWTLVLASPIK